MAEISGLLEILSPSLPTKDLPLRLRSEAVRLALRRLLDLLDSGISDGFQTWTVEQIGAVASIARSVLAAVIRVSVWQVEPVVVKVVEKSLEFCLVYLEKSGFEGDDFSLQDEILELLELPLLERAIGDQERTCFGHFSSLVEQTSTISVTSGDFELKNNSTLGYQGPDYLKGQNLVKSILPVSYDHAHLESVQPPTVLANLRSSDCVFFSVRQSAIARLKVLPRLLKLSRKLLQSASFDEQMNDPKFGLRLAFSLKVVDLLKHLVKELAHVAFDVELLHAIVDYADILPSLFRMRLDIANHDMSIKGSKSGSLLFQLLEEFLHFVQIGCHDGVIVQNIKVCIVASLLDILDSKIWRYDRAGSPLRPPVVYCPEIALLLLNLLKDVKSWSSQSYDSNVESIMALTDHNYEVESGMPLCYAHGEKVFLTKRLTFEKYLELIFPQSVQWIDNLIHLAFFWHSEVVKSALIIEKSHISSTKPVVALDLDSTSLHEEEALFGNLFSEVTRPAGAADGSDQSTAMATNVSRNPDMATQALTELLVFLRQCIFSPDWINSKFSDACRKLEQKPIIQLLSILSCRACKFGEKNSPSHPSTNASPVFPHEACYELFLSLLNHQAFSSSLKEHLADEVLKVEDGNYVYNYYTLSLLAHTLLLKEDMADNRLTMKIFEKYVEFITEKTNYMSSRFPDHIDFGRCLPSDFHLELVLMSFHLSNDDEKASLVKFLYSSLRKVESPSEFNVNQLFFWGLYVSRLVLVLRHVLLYQLSCPTWLIMRLRSRLIEVPNNACNPTLQLSHMSSWVSDVVDSILGDNHGVSASALGSLLPQLIDVAPLPSPLCVDNSAVQKIGFDWDSLISAFSSILCFWSGKKANTADQMILERYIFSLCWDTISANDSVQYSTSLDLFKSKTIDLTDVKSFFNFALVVIRRRAYISEDPNLSEVLSNVLVQLQAEQLPDDPSVLDWNFLRKGAWLSLVLFLIRSGLSNIPRRSEVPAADLDNAQHAKFSEQRSISEVTYSDMFQGNRAGWLLNTLSSILKMYLQTFQSAFICSLDCHQSSQGSLSPFVLLKHTGFNEGKHNVLLESTSLNSPNLESISRLLSKFDEIITPEETRSERSIMLRCLLHGFPANSDASGAALLSCILIVSDIISVLAEYFEVKDEGESKQIDVGVISQLLGTVMAVKSDKIFQYIHGKCNFIADKLISPEELPGLHDLFVLKQLEGFLSEANSKDAIDTGLHEILIDSVVGSIEALRGDSLKQQVFKFYMGCSEGIPQKAKELLSEQCGDLLILINALDKCHAETVNVKILNLFVDLLSDELYSDLKERVQKKFLDMDLLSLSSWLEKRFLGYIAEAAAGDSGTKGVSAAVRDSTMNFILSLISQPQEMLSKELHGRFTEAMLMLLDRAFTLCDTQLAKAYFSFVLKLFSGESSLRRLLEKIMTLMEKLAGSESLLPGLKVLIGFVGGVLGDFGADKSSSEKVLTHFLTSNSSGQGSAVPKSVIVRKNSDNLVLPSNQESGSASVDCDATSADDDDDDGTSDGELGSIEKDEEDESNSERALASKVCTFTSSGNNFMEQHWYFCYTCDLTVSKGCCSICAKVCHRGHRVVYSRSSRFFCDCGAGGVRGSSCQCLKPRKFSGSNNPPTHGPSNYQSFLPLSSTGDQTVDSDSDLDDDVYMDGENSFKLSIPKELQDELPAMLLSLDVEARLLEICNKLLPTIVSRRESNLSKDNKVILGSDKLMCYNTDIFQLKKAYKGGSLDLKIKADYPNSRELKSLIACGAITKSLLTVSPRGRLAVGEGDKVAIFDVGQLIGQPTIAPVTADKTNVKPLSKNIVRFEIVHLIFNPIVENYLVVAGLEDCQVLTVNPRGEVTDRLAIELALQGAHICRVDWVPGSQVQLMVVTNKFVKIYDLSQDSISPMHYFTSSDDMIADATLVPAPMGRAYLFVLSQAGKLFRLEVSMEGDVGARVLTDIIGVPETDGDSKGLSLYFSSTYRLLFLSFQDGNTVMARLDDNAKCLVETSRVYESDQDGKLRPAGLHHWKELLPGSGLFVCLSSLKSNVALSVYMNLNELFAQNLRYGAGSSISFVGIAAYKPLSKDGTYCLVLQDDGSLQIYAHIRVGAENASNDTAEQTKKLGPSILSNKAYAGVKPEFPLDFFERTMSITADVKLSTDAVKNGDSESVKQRLASDDGFLEASTSTGFKITVTNCNPDIVMVGCRIHVGNTSANHIPSEVTVFQRVVKLDEGMRSWYDIPFTVAESLLADEEFTISVGPTFDGSTMPRVDSLEIYGRAKDEFGWKEKMEAVLDMEAHALGSNSGPAGSARKCRTLQSATVQEQVLADLIKLLSRIYSFGGPYNYLETADLDECLKKLRCKSLLETIFQSDREPLLHSSACHVLRSVFPKREVYYRVKDTMRLLGVVNSFPVLVSRIGVGGAAAVWVIKEFTSQMHAVSKIAVNRRPNMAAFLESHGSEVVDGLMQVLWGILDLERPETQTINNIIIPAVELIYSYAECLALRGNEIQSVVPAVALLKKLLFAPYESVQTSSSLAISSRLLQVPFPKQTMLTSDDNAENPVPAHVPSDANTNSRSGPAMIEEDSTTSSVQYCCDGCSTVPIIRRRWHCNICPDFDLCEACYEVLDADQLPPPHSRDHPMSAIPIDIDSVGNDGGTLHFSMDELTDSNLAQVSAEINTHNSSPSIHALETSECGEFPASASDQTVVSISASQRALNSLLLRCLIKELNGWMETTSGFRAIPVMQLFYRLSSAVGGPLMDSSKPENLDLEKLVKWLLDEINLNKPFPAKSRSPFGEVAILIFMFFTLMLRSWHQPSGDGSHSKSGNTVHQDRGSTKAPLPPSAAPSSASDPEKDEFAAQLIRACSFLRKQDFLNYLMDILQQLVEIFKSSLADSDSSLSASPGCGSLLTVRRELPAGNFAPFFTDSYAKSHRSDIFTDYHKLLLENTFRLVYSLVRPEKQEKSGEREKMYRTAGKELKLDEFQDVLCSYMSNPQTSFVKRHARRLLLHLCGSKTQYYCIRDNWQFSNEVKKLYKLVNKSGGFQNPVPYERSVKLVKCLCAISEVAGARPRNWQKYCIKHTELLPFLLNGIFYFGEESVIQTLKLLNLAFYTGKDMGHTSQRAESVDNGTTSRSSIQSSDLKKKRKVDDGLENGSEKPILDMEQAVETFSKNDDSVLRQFIDSFLLEWNSSNVRNEAKNVLYGIWHHGKQSFGETLLTALLKKVKDLPMYGQNILEYTELLTWLLGKVPDSTINNSETEIVARCLTPEVISCISDTLHSQNELLANHPNSHIYNTLSGLVEFDGYYLESEPCVSCSCPEVPYSRMKLESLKSETKFTDNRIIVKCTGSYTIQSVTMNVHDARKSKTVKFLNLYYNNRTVGDLSELKNNWSLWKRAKSCHLAFNQTELKVEFAIPITACNFMIELDSFYENLQASSLESLQCPRCSRSVTDKHGICSNCHENAYQCRQCRNINYENLDSFLCNECGYSKYGRFEFNFMAKPSFSFDSMENDEDMKKGLAAIESESENAHRRYQQLLGFKKPLLKLVSSIGENEIDSQHKDSVQQMMVSLPGPSCKINRKIALLGVLYGEKCKTAFDSVSKSVQTLQGLRRVLLTYLHQKNSDDVAGALRFSVPRSPNNCYGCATTFVTQCLELLQVLSKHTICKKQLVSAGILKELFENNIHQGPKTARVQARAVLCALSEGDAEAVSDLNTLIQKKVMYCLEHHRSMDIALATREELLLLSESCSLVDEHWEARLRVAFRLLFASIKLGGKHPAISEHIILPCLRIISQACTPPRSDAADREQVAGKSTLQQAKTDHSAKSSVNFSTPNPSKSPADLMEKHWAGVRKGQDIPLLSYSEWERGASYLDFVRRQYKVSQAVKGVALKARQESHRSDYLALKYALRWRRRACMRTTNSEFSRFTLGSWVSELILSACSQSIRSEVSTLVSLICPQNTSRRFQLLNLLMSLLPATLSVGESAAEYFELFFKMIDSETSRLYLTVKGCLTTICKLITREVCNVESQEMSLSIDISQGFILHKLIELLSKFLEVPNIRVRFMHDELLSDVLEALLVIRGLVVQKTKLISDCNCLLKELLDSLLHESTGNKRQFIRACVSGLQNHKKERKGRTSLFILEQLCNLICPSKPEPVYLLVLNKAHTQEEFIRGSMTKNPYSSTEIGPLMRDVKNKICHQLDLLGLLEDDYGMELLVAGNIISLDLSISQVYEQVWKKYHSQAQNTLAGANVPSSTGVTSVKDFPPMTVTYRLQGLDGEATEPMIKELEEEREESQDPEVEFAIAGAVRECGGLEIILGMIQNLRDEELKSNKEELGLTLNLLMYCCKIRENRRALLRLGALGLLLETARRAFSIDAMEPAEGILLIVESLTIEANESDIGIDQSVLTVTNEESGAGEQAKKIVLMFLERLCHPLGVKKSSKQQRNNEMVARILPYLTYGQPEAMESLVQHFSPYLQDWCEFDRLQQKHQANPKDEDLAQQAAKYRSSLENFVRVSESLKTSSCGERLKDIILEKGITTIAVRHLRESFAVTGQAGFRSSAEWITGLNLPSVPLILSMLRGLSTAHFATQRCIEEEGILPLLHALEGVTGENEIGARAENLLDTLSDKESNGDGFLGEKIHKLRHATRDEMRRLALRRREELLQGLGMRQEYANDGGERIVVAQPVIEGLEDVEEEEDGLACMVCREGYTLRPSDMLGVYCYSKRVNLGASSSSSGRSDCVYTTVSHFNVIHFQCHQEAKRADAALRNPKKEWEGATLRNNETLCNCIFPLRGPSVPLSQYARCVDQYWDNLNALGRADGSRLRLLTYDIVLMLARFATGASFSTDCRGGGRESNSHLLPFMIQMASYLLDQGSSNQQRRAIAKSVAAYISNSSSADSPSRLSSSVTGVRLSGASDETVQFMMVNSLLSESYEDWLQHRPAFLQRGIYHAYMQHKHGKSSLRLSDASASARSDEGSSTDLSDGKKLFAIVQPMLIFTGLIEQLQKFFKFSKAAATVKEPTGDGSSGLERWEIVMKEKMVNIKEMVGFSKELLSWLEDMTSATDLQEAFDVMGALADALSGGNSRCEDFVQAAILAAKS